MRKSFTLLFMVLLCALSHIYTALQGASLHSGGVLVLPLQSCDGCPEIDPPCMPCPPDGIDCFNPCDEDPPGTPIHNIIIPFLLVNVVFLTIYIVKKNKRLKKIRRARRISRIRKRLAKH